MAGESLPGNGRNFQEFLVSLLKLLSAKGNNLGEKFAKHCDYGISWETLTQFLSFILIRAVKVRPMAQNTPLPFL